MLMLLMVYCLIGSARVCVMMCVVVWLVCVDMRCCVHSRRCVVLYARGVVEFD